MRLKRAFSLIGSTSRALAPPLLRAFSAAAPPPSPAAAKEPTPAAKLLALNQALLDAVMRFDWATYSALCDPSLSCWEAEARGAFVVGLDFHKIYYDNAPVPLPKSRVATMASPHVRFLGPHAAVLSYVRLVQSVGSDGAHSTARVEETRVWARKGPLEKWLLVHLCVACSVCVFLVRALFLMR